MVTPKVCKLVSTLPISCDLLKIFHHNGFRPLDSLSLSSVDWLCYLWGVSSSISSSLGSMKDGVLTCPHRVIVRLEMTSSVSWRDNCCDLEQSLQYPLVILGHFSMNLKFIWGSCWMLSCHSFFDVVRYWNTLGAIEFNPLYLNDDYSRHEHKYH